MKIHFRSEQTGHHLCLILEKTNILCKISFIMDDLSSAHAAKNLPEYNIASCNIVKRNYFKCFKVSLKYTQAKIGIFTISVHCTVLNIHIG